MSKNHDADTATGWESLSFSITRYRAARADSAGRSVRYFEVARASFSSDWASSCIVQTVRITLDIGQCLKPQLLHLIHIARPFHWAAPRKSSVKITADADRICATSMLVQIAAGKGPRVEPMKIIDTKEGKASAFLKDRMQDGQARIGSAPRPAIL